MSASTVTGARAGHSVPAALSRLRPNELGAEEGSNRHLRPADYRTSLAIVPIGADGSIKLHVLGSDAIGVVVDVVGWYSNVLSPITNGQNITGSYSTLHAGAGSGAWNIPTTVGLSGTFSNIHGREVPTIGWSRSVGLVQQ